MESSFQELSVKIKNKSQLYDVLAKIYYLPDFGSRAVTKDYLMKHIYAQPQIFMLNRKQVIQHHFRYYKFSALELLEILEEMLRQKGKKPTGLNPTCLPNIEWLMNAILALDISEPYELLQPKKEEKISYKLEVSQE